jgi:Ca-activated chloride channel homolog
MFNPHGYENSRAEGVATLTIVQRPEPDAPEAPEAVQAYMPLTRTDLTGRITGPLAYLRLIHTYRHPDADHGPVLEAVYRFPLPGDAAVMGVIVRFGEVEIRAEIAERERAEQEYDEARASGRQAALLTRESPDVFTLHVSGIESGQDIVVETTYVQLARAEGAGFTLRAPLTPAPRYTGLHELGSRHAAGQPLALARDPGHRFALELRASEVTEVTSSTHELTLSDAGDEVTVKLRDGEIVPDRDLIISWKPRTLAERPRLQVWADRARDHSAALNAGAEAATSPDDAGEWPDANRYDYFLALVSPPEKHADQVTIPREVILLVDRSGSMSGAKWQAADWAVRRFLSSLRAEDSFSLSLFHSHTRWFSRAALPASQHNVDAARHFLDRYDDSGGTELGTALAQALATERATGERARHVLIITDAQVSDMAAILDLARQEAKRRDRRRISVLCVDAAPNSHLVHELVDLGGGRACFLTSDPEQDDITTALDDVMSWWDAPVAAGLTLTVNRSGAWAMGRPARDETIEVREAGTAVDRHEISRVDLGDLPAGRSIWVVGRVPVADGTSSPLEFQVHDARAGIVATGRPDVQVGSASEPAIKALFGARRLLNLEYRLNPIFGSAFPWRARHGEATDVDARERLRKLLVAEALHYGLVSSETAFVAVRQEAGRVVERGALVPNALPSGWDDDLWLASPARAYQAMPIPASPAAPGVVYSESIDPAHFDTRMPPTRAPGRARRDQDDSLLRRAVQRFRRGDEPASERPVSKSEFSYDPPGPESRVSEARASISAGEMLLFDGVPGLENGAAVLFETGRLDRVPGNRSLMLTGLRIELRDDGRAAGGFDGTLVIDGGDGTAPRARVRISDVTAQGGNRPLNLLLRPDEQLRLTLVDADDTGALPALRVTVFWRVA